MGGAGWVTRIVPILAAFVVCALPGLAMAQVWTNENALNAIGPSDQVADADTTSIATASPPAATLDDEGAAQIGGNPVALPLPLDPDDARRYVRIFALQEHAHWAAADQEIAKLHDRLLMGYVLAQRYLFPRDYRSSYKELRDWLAKYSDLPQASWIYSLAMKRKPKRAAAPVHPEGGYLTGSGYDVDGGPPPSAHSSRALSEHDRRRVAAIKSRIGSLIRAGRPDRARRLIETAEAHRVLSRSEMDAARAKIAAGYFSQGHDGKARAIADHVRYVGETPEANWVAGLAAWRQGDFAAAASHFEAVAESDDASAWEQSAGAYWAARANLVIRRPQRVTQYLQIAADYDHTFYGILARRALAIPPSYNWQAPALDQARLALISGAKWGQRALALLQIGKLNRADQELRKDYVNVDPDAQDAILALALNGNLPSLAMRIGSERLHDTGEVLDAALYPVPSWRPANGFTMNRALVLAVIRQESHFNTGAVSGSGALGLMQVMPDTARFVNDGKPLTDDNEEDALRDPQRNMTLGQAYLEHLLSNDSVDGNLVLLTAAYNGGPGNLARWQLRSADYDDDPLLFIESIPVKETRMFVEHVFANMWIYQQRLGQPSPSLDSVVAGEWPRYAALDDHVEVVDRGGN